MTIKKRRVEGLLATADQNIGTVTGGPGSWARFGKVLGFRARNYASSAKAGAGTDTAVKVKLTDANGDVIFLDAIDRDYATNEVTLQLLVDDTLTGLGITPVDGTGAAAAAGETAGPPLAEFPITVNVSNGATATDYFSIDVLVEVD